VNAMLHRLAVFSMILSGAGACGALERWACGDPCEGGVLPADGSTESFTLAGLEEADATVSEATPCEDFAGEQVHVVQVVTHGADAEIREGEWISDRLRPALLARGISTSWGMSLCTDPAGTPDPARHGLGVGTTDWADVDPIVQTILELARDDDAALQLTITIEPVVIACPDDDCGT
jgi:hypothetical protein